MELPKEFTDALMKDPGLITKLQKREELEEFKCRFNVTKSSSLKCPACSSYLLSGGSLWYNPNNTKHFACRKCQTEFSIECLTEPNELLINRIRTILKGESTQT